MAINQPQLFLSTAGGRIRCARCTAQSTRTKIQCGRPALTTSKTQKCQFHGGRGSGPKSEEGRSRIAAAHYKHGESTKAARAEYSKASARLNQLEDAMHLLKMTTAPRTRGRKPSGYKPVLSTQDLIHMVLDTGKNYVEGAVGDPKNFVHILQQYMFCKVFWKSCKPLGLIPTFLHINGTLSRC
jgi:hypothetical protein